MRGVRWVGALEPPRRGLDVGVPDVLVRHRCPAAGVGIEGGLAGHQLHPPHQPAGGAAAELDMGEEHPGDLDMIDQRPQGSAHCAPSVAVQHDRPPPLPVAVDDWGRVRLDRLRPGSHRAGPRIGRIRCVLVKLQRHRHCVPHLRGHDRSVLDHPPTNASGRDHRGDHATENSARRHAHQKPGCVGESDAAPIERNILTVDDNPSLRHRRPSGPGRSARRFAPLPPSPLRRHPGNRTPSCR